jgi:hypothetical protein
MAPRGLTSSPGSVQPTARGASATVSVGRPAADGPACDPGHDEQQTIADIVTLRAEGKSLMAIRDEMRARGFPISHKLVANTLQRHAAAAGGVG